MAGDRLDALEPLQLRRRAVSLHDHGERTAGDHALLGRRRCQWDSGDHCATEGNETLKLAVEFDTVGSNSLGDFFVSNAVA